jgi:TolB-like protein
MSLLCLLLEPPLRVRTRAEIQRRLWPENIFVDFEHGMNKTVHSLREALGDSANNPRFIETVNSTGYRFIPQTPEFHGLHGVGSQFGKPQYIAVLPLSNNGSSEMALRCARITSRLLDGLPTVTQCRIMAQATVKSYNIDGRGPQHAGQVLGVDAVITGELLRSGKTLFLRAELIDVSDGSQLCGAHAEAVDTPGAPFDDELLAGSILKQLRLALGPISEPASPELKPVLVKS